MNNLRMKSLYGLLLYFVIYTLGAFVIQFIIGFVISNVYDISFATLLSTNPFNYEVNSKMYLASLNLLTYTNLFLYIAYFIGFVIMFFKELKSDLFDYKNKWVKNTIYIVLGITILYSSNILINKLASINGVDQSSNQKLIEAMFSNNGMIPVFLSVVLFAPIVEEMVYRKCIYGICQNKILYYIIAPLLFGFIHMSTMDGSTPLAWFLTFLPYATSGLILAITYERTENIYVSTGVHMLNNLIGFILLCV